MWVTLPTPEATALGCIRCVPGGETPPAWGMGSTCQASIDDAIANASALIPASCTTCLETPIEVTPCHLCGAYPDDPPSCTSANNWRADYKIKYRCEVNICQ